MDYHAATVDDVLREMGTRKSGLSGEEARKRLGKYGTNELKQERKINPLKIFLSQFRSFLVIVLIVAALISAFLINSILDSIVILIIIILNAVLGFVQEYKAEREMEALKKMVVSRCMVMRDGKKEEIESRYLVPGDIVVLEEGMKVPADVRIMEETNLRADESSLTGESEVVSKDAGAVAGKVEIADRRNMLYAGTIISSGRSTGVVVSTGMGTEIGRIAAMIQTEEVKRTPLQDKLDAFGRNLGFLILGICAVIVVVGFFRGEAIIDAFITGVALAVAAIPEGLPAVVTITLAMGLKKMARKNAVVRKLSAVETLGSTNVICSDKTGTLTRNEMVVTDVFADGKVIGVTGNGYEPKGRLIGQEGEIRPGRTMSMLLKAAALCNNSELSSKGGWSIIGDPTEGALKALSMKFIKDDDYERVHEVPFASERKRMETVNKIGGKHFVFSKGATEILLSSCSRIMKGGRISKLTDKERKDILQINSEFAGRTLRVLALAYREIGANDVKNGKKICSDLVFLGLAGMMDPPRAGVEKDIELCRRAGIRTVMITGDHRETAVAIAKRIGIMHEGDNVLTGSDIESMDEKELSDIIEKTPVFARVNPSHKVKILRAFKSKGSVVAMTGDGVNDAPALKKADIGVAMGLKGTDVAKEASDMILKDDNFSTIVSAIEGGRIIFDNILKFVRNLLSSNMGEVLLITLALIINFTNPETGLFVLPLTAVQILWINLVTDGLPSVALGIDNPESGIMKRKPRPPGERILSGENLVFILLAGVVTALSALYIFMSELPYGAERAQAMAFTGLVFAEMFNVFNSRSSTKSVFSRDVPNKWLLLAISSTIILQVLVVYLPLLQEAFGTMPLDVLGWAKILGASFAVVVAVEIWKLFRKWRSRVS